MDTTQILVTAAVGLAASVVTAVVTHVLTREQERRKHEREVAAKLAGLNSMESSVTQVMATQYAQACLVVEREGEVERDRVFIPVGCRITLGRGAENHIVVDHRALSKQHVAFRALGSTTYLEPLSPTNGVAINGNDISKPTKLSNGDVVSVPGSSFKLTFVALRS
jgi:hypothetical protein